MWNFWRGTVQVSHGFRGAQTGVTVPLRAQPSGNLYKRREEIVVPSAGKLEEFRNLVLDAKSGHVSVDDEVSNVSSVHLQ